MGRRMGSSQESSHIQIVELEQTGVLTQLQEMQWVIAAEVKMHYNSQGCTMEHSLESKEQGIKSALVGAEALVEVKPSVGVKASVGV